MISTLFNFLVPISGHKPMKKYELKYLTISHLQSYIFNWTLQTINAININYHVINQFIQQDTDKTDKSFSRNGYRQHNNYISSNKRQMAQQHQQQSHHDEKNTKQKT